MRSRYAEHAGHTQRDVQLDASLAVLDRARRRRRPATELLVRRWSTMQRRLIARRRPTTRTSTAMQLGDGWQAALRSLSSNSSRNLARQRSGCWRRRTAVTEFARPHAALRRDRRHAGSKRPSSGGACWGRQLDLRTGTGHRHRWPLLRPAFSAQEVRASMLLTPTGDDGAADAPPADYLRWPASSRT